MLFGVALAVLILVAGFVFCQNSIPPVLLLWGS
jgi:hypothetical protein